MAAAGTLTSDVPFALPTNSESITITKRLLIEGEGALGEAVIDQRANCPTFRIARCGAGAWCGGGEAVAG